MRNADRGFGRQDNFGTEENIEFFTALDPEEAAAGAARTRRLAARNNLRKKRRRAVLLCGGVLFAVFFLNWLTRSPVTAIGAKRAQSPSSRSGSGVEALTPEFAIIDGANLALRLPARLSQVTAIGYHQAYNPKAYPLIPQGGYLQGEAIKAQIARLTAEGKKPAFVMYARGRRSQATSSADIVMPIGPPVLSPVSGIVRAVVPYKLYGRIDDVRLEIIPDGHPEIVIAMVHIADLKVVQGQRLAAGRTPLAVLRPLGIKSQIDEYTGLTEDHVHIQVNPSAPEPVQPAPAPVGRR